MIDTDTRAATDLPPMAKFVEDFDWASHPFGRPDSWPRALRSVMRFMLDAAFPAALWLGPDLRLFYNDAYRPILGPRHPSAFGRKGRDVWGELWDIIGPQFEQVVASGKGMSISNQMLPMTRYGYEEETWWDYTFSPLTADNGTISGVINEAHDVTAIVIRERHDRLMLALDDQLQASATVDGMIDAALALIGEHLRVTRTGLGEIDRETRELVIERCWVASAMPDITGRYPLGSFGDISAELASGASVRIEDNLTDPRTADAATLERYRRIELRAGIVTPIIDRERYAGGIFAQDRVPRRWTDAEVALVEGAAKRLWQAVQRRRAESRLRDSEERFRLIFEQAEDIIFTADVDQRITDANAAGLRAIGLPREQLVGRSIAEFVTPDDFTQTTAMLNRKIEHGGHTRHEVGVTSADGRRMRWENNSTLVIGRDEKPIGLLSVSRDVTERRAFEERRELLIHELNHRVKNTLALVQGLAHQSFRERPEDAVQFSARLAALARAHDLLTREHWEGATIRDLVDGASAAFGGVAERIIAEGPALTVSPRAAVALVMALHELMTNAVKYGALSDRYGNVTIAWEEHKGGFSVTWRESGGPSVVVPERRGFGIKMIERALAHDLGGTVKVDFNPAGLRCTIEAPLPAEHART